MDSKFFDCKRFIFVVISALIIAMNMNSFVSTAGLFPGGFNGMSVLIQRVLETYLHIHVSFSVINLSLNVIPIIIGLRLIGKKFTFYSVIMIGLSSVFVDMLPQIAITEDILLVSIFGGIINGVAIVIALRGKACSGGTDFIAIAISQKTKKEAWNYIMIANALMLLLAGALFGWDKALYSIIFQFCSTQVVKAYHVQYKKLSIFIITENPEEVIQAVIQESRHTLTCLEGYGGYTKKQKTMLYSVISHGDVERVRYVVQKVDSHAFMSVLKTDMIYGNFYQKPMD